MTRKTELVIALSLLALGVLTETTKPTNWGQDPGPDLVFQGALIVGAAGLTLEWINQWRLNKHLAQIEASPIKTLYVLHARLGY